MRPTTSVPIAVLAVACLFAWTTGCAQTSEPADNQGDDGSSGIDAGGEGLDGGSSHELVNADGRFAFPAPRLAEQVSFEDGDDGGSKVRLKVDYAVANPSADQGAAPDKAEVTLRVAQSMFRTGPQPNDPIFTKMVTDDKLDDSDVTRSYEFDLPAEVRQFLESQGATSDDPTARANALALVNIGVQQYRDFRTVDGTLDWIHGSTFNAAQSPTKPADNPGGALTVSNDTATGIYTYDSASLEPVQQLYGPNLYPAPGFWETVTTESTGVSIALAGVAVSCLYQGTDGSNPTGFNQNLAPGVAVTQTIVADDSSFDTPSDNTEAAAASDAIEDTLKAGVAAFNISLSLLFGGPFTLIVAMATNLLDLGSDCNNQPNLMQLGAVTQSGQGSNSTTWAAWDGCGGTCGGFANVYTSPWESSAPDLDAELVNNAVQLAPDGATTYQGQPLWLAQTPIAGCGIGDSGDSSTSGCTSQNMISLRWSTQIPCPWNNGEQIYSGGIQGDSSLCYQPPPTSPEVAACGSNNSQCLSYDPN